MSRRKPRGVVCRGVSLAGYVQAQVISARRLYAGLGEVDKYLRMTDYDSIYHRLFDHAGMVAQLLRGFVPLPLLDDFDMDGITRLNAKLHADIGSRRDGDTAWRIPKRSGGETYVLLLLEFQSTIAPRMALRLLVYAGLLWQHLERQERLLPGGRLPPVLPIVLYRGETPWSAPLSLRQLVGLAADSPLWEWQPDLHYYIIDAGRVCEPDLESREGLLPLLFRLESAKDLNQLVVASGALSAWFAANSAPATLRTPFIELVRAAMKPFVPGMQVPDDLLESGNMLVDRVKQWREDLIQDGRQEGRLARRDARRARQLSCCVCWSGVSERCRVG